jgi:hypothetical protein
VPASKRDRAGTRPVAASSNSRRMTDCSSTLLTFDGGSKDLEDGGDAEANDCPVLELQSGGRAANLSRRIAKGHASSHLSGARHPAASASAWSQNHRSPFDSVTLVRSYHCDPHGV